MGVGKNINAFEYADEFIRKLSENKEEYYDSGFSHFIIGSKVANAILCLDVDNALLLYAKQNGFDTIIVHHSIGKQYYKAAHEIERRYSFLMSNKIIEENEINIFEETTILTENMWNANKISICGLAERLGINIISCHSLADELVAKLIRSRIESIERREGMLEELDSILDTKIVYNEYCIKPHAYGKLSGRYNKAYIDVSYAVPPSPYVISKVVEAGYDFLVLTAISKDCLKQLTDRNITIYVVNHLQLDLLAMKLLQKRIQSVFPDVKTTYI